jgi:hypothetical protein
MDRWLFGEPNVNKLYNILESKIDIKNIQNRSKLKKFLIDNMRKVYNEKKNNVPKGPENLQKFLEYLNQQSIMRCMNMLSEKRKKIQHNDIHSDSQNINEYKMNREKQLYNNREMIVSSRPNYTQVKNNKNINNNNFEASYDNDNSFASFQKQFNQNSTDTYITADGRLSNGFNKTDNNSGYSARGNKDALDKMVNEMQNERGIMRGGNMNMNMNQNNTFNGSNGPQNRMMQYGTSNNNNNIPKIDFCLDPNATKKYDDIPSNDNPYDQNSNNNIGGYNGDYNNNVYDTYDGENNTIDISQLTNQYNYLVDNVNNNTIPGFSSEGVSINNIQNISNDNTSDKYNKIINERSNNLQVNKKINNVDWTRSVSQHNENFSNINNQPISDTYNSNTNSNYNNHYKNQYNNQNNNQYGNNQYYNQPGNNQLSNNQFGNNQLSNNQFGNNQFGNNQFSNNQLNNNQFSNNQLNNNQFGNQNHLNLKSGMGLENDVLKIMSEKELDEYINKTKKKILDIQLGQYNVNPHLLQTMDAEQLEKIIKNISNSLLDITTDNTSHDKNNIVHVLEQNDIEFDSKQSITSNIEMAKLLQKYGNINNFTELIVSSTDNNSEYSFAFKKIFNIKEIILMDYKFPNIPHNITNLNNKLSLKKNNTELQILEIPDNIYNSDALIDTIDKMLLQFNLTIKIDTYNKIIIKSTNSEQFSMVDDDDSVLNILGFTKKIYEGLTSYRSETTHKITTNNMVYLFITNISNKSLVSIDLLKKPQDICPININLIASLDLENFEIILKSDLNNNILYKEPHEFKFKIIT